MTDAAIAISHLSKIYEGGKQALDDVSFDVPRGSIFGLLGPNGAGKSTLINILAGLVNKSSGSASIWGFDVDQHPRNAKVSIGIVNQESPSGARANYRTAGLADMAASLIDGRDARCSLDRTLHGVDVMTSILKSGEEGRFIDLTTTCTQPAALGIEEAQALLK